MKRLLSHSLLFILCIGSLSAQTTRFVNPMIGTGGHGHTFPGAVMPFGMVQLSPDTRLEGWDGCSGYHFSDSIIYGFSHTHLSGTGVPDYCDILLMPSAGNILWDNGYKTGAANGYASTFNKKNEHAVPGYYTVVLDEHEIGVQLAATERAGMHGYYWPGGKQNPHIMLDLTHRDKTLDSWIRVVNDSTVLGMRRSEGWAQDQVVYFAMEFSQPFSSWKINEGGAATDRQAEAKGSSLKAAFAFDLPKGGLVQVRVGISSVDEKGAMNNLRTEMSEWDLATYVTNANKAWERQLGKIQIKGGAPADFVKFYTALYHTMIHPSLHSDVDGRYRGRDNQIHQLPAGQNHYTVFSLWDTYRTLHPLFTLIEEQRTKDILETFVRQYREGGRLPVWELAGNETDCMIGYHSVSVIADAWMKGYRTSDPEVLLDAMLHSAKEDRFGVGALMKQGYLESSDVSESVSRVLEYAYDDWCIAQVAGSLGKAEVRDEFMRRSQAWRSHFDRETGFLRARTNGGWWEPFEPREVNFNFTEANAWQYSLAVPQDIPGLATLHGGPAGLRRHLDKLFTAPASTVGREQADITGLIGQYAHGNEPSHHMAYLYNFTDEPWKTRMFVGKILRELYTTGPDGLSGNEDCGQMSAWYVMSALGIYPVTPGDPTYAIGMPNFDEAAILFENGQRFTIRRKLAESGAENPFLSEITLNGNAWSMLAIPHSVIARGGEVNMQFSSQPSQEGKWLSPPLPKLPTCGEANAITPAPVVLASSRSFTESLAVDIQCLSGNCDRLLLWNENSNGWDTLSASSCNTIITENTHFKVKAWQNGCEISGEVNASFFRRDPSIRLELQSKYANEYAAGGRDALIDGIRGSADFRTGDWQGYREDLIATVDLGKARSIQEVKLSCLQDQKSWIWMPHEVIVETSKNGKSWKPLGAPVKPSTMIAKEGATLEEMGVSGMQVKARHVRITAKVLPIVPSWHIGAGGKPWIFVDEIIVR